MSQLNDYINKGTYLKESATSDLTFFGSQLKETVINAVGIGWLMEDGLSNIKAAVTVFVLWYVRWMIKMAIFIYGALLLTDWLCPHSGAKFW